MEEIDSKKVEEKKESTVINRQKIKILTYGHRLSSEYLEELEKKVEKLIYDSVTRAVGNRRNTLLARDL